MQGLYNSLSTVYQYFISSSSSCMYLIIDVYEDKGVLRSTVNDRGILVTSDLYKITKPLPAQIDD